ncbi:MAG TPA: hypothetical protein VH370_12375 [Humisphaera sp.]|nr:hypothetical protein [Humisphaera sp.]
MSKKKRNHWILSVLWTLLPLALLCVAIGLLIYFLGKHAPWALALLAVGAMFLPSTVKTQMKMQEHFKSRGVITRGPETMSADERRRLAAPRGTCTIRYRDSSDIEYWAAAIYRKRQLQILHDIPRQDYESQKPPWKVGDPITLEMLKELGNPAPPQKYLQSLLLKLKRSDGQAVIDEQAGLPELEDSPRPASFASLLQAAQLACHTADLNGSAEMSADGENNWVMAFACVGEPGRRVLTFTFKRETSS